MSEEKQKSNTSRAIGIDLGTTFSCVAGYIGGKVEIITNSDGERTTPSVVSFDENDCTVVGTAAKNMAGLDPTSVLFDSKRMIGRDFDDPKIQNMMSGWPFKIVRYNGREKKEMPHKDPSSTNSYDNMAYKFTKNGKTKYYTPPEISSKILSNLKKAAEARLGGPVDAMVVTVPAYFEDPQKAATKAAATIAGFNEDRVRLLAEPTAAALAYAHIQTQKNANFSAKEDVLVFDLGGGTFDVSVLDFEFNATTGTFGIVKAIDGDTFLGGQDFDNLLINYCISEFLKKNPSIQKTDLKESALLRLRAECTRVKAVLSSATSSTIYVPCFHMTDDLNVQITRARFELLCDHLFKKCMERTKGCLLRSTGVPSVEYSSDGNKLLLNPSLEKTLNEARNNISKVLLVGGSSRIPKVKALLAEYFGAHKVIEPVNADEAVAYGAAYQAASIYSDAVEAGSSLLLIDCVPLNLSIETAGGVATPLINCGDNIPIKKTETFTTYEDNQTAVTINVHEGNRPMCKDNKRIGTFNLDGIIPGPRGTAKIEVTFDVDHNGILVVTAEDKQTGKSNKITVTNSQNRLSQEEIERMAKEARDNEQRDNEVKEKMGKRMSFDQAIFTFKGLLEKANISQEKKDESLNFIKEHEEWLSKAQGPDDFEVEELERRSNELQSFMNDIMKESGMSAPTA
ncbi:Hsp70 [Encephalitozoon intestinalis ATCC 50506]|uniref:Hsp70 n=1 Tax=Encephalitozoon intestinalis (strain ATCC 50506) TaxID=876142 RepID=E0S652_ENCIT|nr:Hsp70 [Encephalitozoon intestinalis ATCC 50506]ADM11187.1 Hsp70 [Encephalitozoon intestinalis ATCC 50506]UTX44854.1 heat shock protein 70 [Encephalitozoon intestinalis]